MFRSSSRQSRQRSIRAAIAVGLLATSCSLLVETRATQCATNDDCTALGPAFAGTTCSDKNVCVGAIPTCTNTQCIAALGPTAACNKTNGQCVELTSPECQKIIGSYQDDNAIVIGAIGSLTGERAESGLNRQNAIQLAVDEIQGNGSGLPDKADGRPRPLAVVSCDEAANPELAAKHLVEDLGVFAIIGGSTSGNTQKIASGWTIPNGVFLIAPSATSAAFTKFPDNGLLWRTAPTDLLQTILIKQLINDQEAAIRDDRQLAMVRLALVYKGELYGRGLRDAISADLSLNKASATAPANSGYFMTIEYDPLAVNAKSAAKKIVAYNPQIVVVAGTTEAYEIVKEVEVQWPKTATDPKLPEYIFSDGLRQDRVRTETPPDDGVRRRIRGTSPGRADWLPAVALETRFQGTFRASSSGFGIAGAYDSLYVIAYSIVAAGDTPLTGAIVAEGIKKLVDGTKIEVGPTRINDALNLLGSGQSIDLDGASGPLNFNLETGEPPVDISAWCLTKSAANKLEFVSTGQYYDTATGKVKGTSVCP
jgi:ABC-type branched-subunit amino acid transport system substrate-binding protein